MKRIKKTDYQERLLSMNGKIPPQVPELEEAIIGALMIEKNAIDQVGFLKPEMFYMDENKAIFEAILELIRENKSVDILTIPEKMKAMQNTDFLLNLMRISSKMISSAHIQEHALIIQDRYIRREMIKYCMMSESESYDESVSVDDIIFKVSENIQSLQENLIGGNDIQPISEVSKDAYDELIRKVERCNSGNQTGVNTGLIDLNRITSGWQKGELIIIAARPAMGKTALALHLAKSAAKTGDHVAVFSLEMNKVSLYNRFLLSESDVHPDNLRDGKLSDNDYQSINSGIDKLYHLPIYIDDNGMSTMGNIRAKCRLLKKRNKLNLAIIDYLQLITPSGDKKGNREQEIATMSREAKMMAKELGIPVLLLSQLSRKVEERADKIPMLSDLRESGAIEQDADMVIFIYRPAYYEIATKPGVDIHNKGKLIIAKNRNGKVGIVKFAHNDSLTKIFDDDIKGYKEYIPF